MVLINWGLRLDDGDGEECCLIVLVGLSKYLLLNSIWLPLNSRKQNLHEDWLHTLVASELREIREKLFS